MRSKCMRITIALMAGCAIAMLAAQMAPAQTYKVLFQFRAGVDGANPWAGLISDSKGNLYGTTESDGAFDYGTVLKLNTAGKETVLYSFTGAGGDGEYPAVSLIRDAAGNLYSTTSEGGIYGGICGARGCGTVFKVDRTGQETVLYDFTGYPDGSNPYAGLVLDASGNLYGTTQVGGSSGEGTVFKVDTTGKESVFYSFMQYSDGDIPYGNLIRDAAGTLYGTTQQGGAYYCGAVFKVDSTGTETVLYSFGPGNNGNDGCSPNGGLVRDASGSLYGTTQYGGGGTACQGIGCGGVWKVDQAGNETWLYSFTGSDGKIPYAGLVRDAKGNLYGTTSEGGAYGLGTVFKIDKTGKETVLHSFKGSDGKIPYASLLQDKRSNLYGTTSAGGAYGGGVVFEITP